MVTRDLFQTSKRKDEKLLALQAKDKLCNDISNKLQQGQLQNKNPYDKENEILKRYVEDGKQRFEVVVLPQVLSGAALQLAHEGLGHNGSPRTYASDLIGSMSSKAWYPNSYPSGSGLSFASGSICINLLMVSPKVFFIPFIYSKCIL